MYLIVTIIECTRSSSTSVLLATGVVVANYLWYGLLLQFGQYYFKPSTRSNTINLNK